MPQKSIFGNNLDLIGITSADKLFDLLKELSTTLKTNFVSYHFKTPVLNIIDAEYSEHVLSNNNLTNKGLIYKCLIPFLGTGLLISAGHKWYHRRKLLTPAFHFTILQKFLDTFKDETKKFLQVLQEHAKNDTPLSLTDTIPKFTLNNICETAMGVNTDDIGKTEEYIENIHLVEEQCVKEFCNPIILISETLFKLTQNYKMICQASEKIHKFSSEVIDLRRKLFKQNHSVVKSAQELDNLIYFRKKRSAMLDTLFEAEQNGLIDNDGIREEVDTFMFEGYDTSSSALKFILLMIAMHDDVQNKCYEEASTVQDLSMLSIQDFQNFKYLECVIKESLRLFPPVPVIERICENETVVGNLVLPKGSNIHVMIHAIHRNEKYFPQPEKFNPNRFLPEYSSSRHAYAFIPFSAGTRNCIGQKFAMLEMKVLLVNIIKNYKLSCRYRMEDIVVTTGLILTTKNPVYVKVKNR